MIGSAFLDKTVLVTGHTGFKGSWLALWLKHIGAKVKGLALAPDSVNNHWDCLGLDIQEYRVDVRDAAGLRKALNSAKPDFIFHLAAQAFVRKSYKDPVSNWQSNVMGTINLLEACRQTPNTAGILVATSDKCYQNLEWNWGYRESDPLGGHDPYSASKAAVELAVSSYRSSFFSNADSPLLATARAGNVVGGGDWSEERLIPDIFRAIELNQPVYLRYPTATRPWQHVLDAICGYLILGSRLLQGDRTCARAWNFGPGPEANRSVIEVLELLGRQWPSLHWECDEYEHPHEAGLLYLDSSEARALLGWKPQWDLETTISRVSEWYQSWSEQGEVISQRQLLDFVGGGKKL
ncbi:CDP-glucose 4,6-dehydratase [Parahaliea maris]|uniref:CDP-glucose 4,6-dehydratase n=2 Tax=Parahaliea maris TaxID=2716870 RepID=A0A5C9A746_9GAMM|nr:CDP-glucose 4,6-dehydratase [Parahaliea maris]